MGEAKQWARKDESLGTGRSLRMYIPLRMEDQRTLHFTLMTRMRGLGISSPMGSRGHMLKVSSFSASSGHKQL